MNIFKPPNIMIFFTLLIGLLLCCGTATALSVIPGATGFGMDTPAGRGGKIIRVTNLNSSGEGSFRAAIEASGPRIVIFEVSGTIIYEGRYKIKNPYITIAGQTAPSPGITLRASTLTVDAHDVLIQHIRVRPGDKGGLEPDNRDAITIGLTKEPEELYNIVIDHCTASWGVDENVDIYGCSNITFRNCIISEPLSNSLHPKGEHSKGLIVGKEANNISVIENLFAHSVDRNPYTSWGRNSAFIANNLIYNPKIANIIIQSGYGPLSVAIVGNVIKGGPNTGSSSREKTPIIKNDLYDGSVVYLSDNRTELEIRNDVEDWSLIKNETESYPDKQVRQVYEVKDPPLWPEGYQIRPYSQVEDYILNNAGARPADRDAVDNRIINDVIHGSGKIIDSTDEVGGWPNLKVNRITHILPNDLHGDDDGDGYTNIEEWLHQMARMVESSVSTPGSLRISGEN